MFRLILRQANWGVLGSIFSFIIGFFVKVYLIDIVGLDEWGKYVAAQTFSSISETLLSLGIPYVIIKFIPSFIEVNNRKAGRLASIFLKYALLIGGLYLVIIYFSSSSINNILYDIDDFSYILFIMCIHVPISMLFGVILSLYRSVLKIKEIVLYGTILSVFIRATLTFIIFCFTDSIVHFIFIEIFTQTFVLFILLYLFNKNEFPIFISANIREVTSNKEMIDYGSKMFYNSVVGFVSAQVLSFIISIKLPMQHVGAYNILLSLTGLTTFLLINLNKVFAPAISKLYNDNNLLELNQLYKKTTFFINILTIPFIISIALFCDEILALYSKEMIQYKNYLFFMLTGGMLSLAAGSSGTFMVMAGLEKANLYIQLIRAIMLMILSLLLIPAFGMKIIVILYVLFMLFTNVSQLVLISINLNITPLSRELIFLFLLTSICMYIAIEQQYIFNMYHYFIVPISLYLIFFTIMFFPIKKLIKDLF